MGINAIDNRNMDVAQFEQFRTEKPESETVDSRDLDKSLKDQEQQSDSNDQPLSEKEQQRRMARLQDTLRNYNIEISYNNEVNRYAIKVLDSDSKEVVKEIPSEKTLDMFAKMLEIEGLLLDERR